MINFRYSFLSCSKIKISVLKAAFRLEKEKVKTKERQAFKASIDK
jgi:hypothetical protein